MYGGLASIFEKDKYFICDEVDEYVKKALEILNETKTFNFEKITEKYTDMKEWKRKFEEVYN